MDNRLFTTGVVLFWLTSMSWLVGTKVLPALWIGDPPSLKAVVAAERREPPAGWELNLNGESLGWAVSMARPVAGGGTELRGWAHFNRLPLSEATPGWVKGLFRIMDQPLEVPKMDARSIFSIDAQGRLSGFRSRVRIAPLTDEIGLDGQVAGTKLTLTVRGKLVGTLPPTEVYLPPGALLGDSLRPQTQLPGLREGQQWSVPVYSPLRPTEPLEFLQARVEGTELISWGNEMIECLVVVYRRDPGAGIRSAVTPRGRAWVRRNGAVLRQELQVFNTTLQFVRLTEDGAAYFARKVTEEIEPQETRKSP